MEWPYELGGVVEDLVLDAGGKARREALHLGIHRLGHGQRIGARRLIDADVGGRHAVERALGGIALRPQLDAGDVAEAHGGAIGGRAQDDLAEVFRRGEPALGTQGVLHLLIVGGRRRADIAYGGLDVLLANGLCHIGGGEAERRHARGIQPDPHAVVPCPEDAGVAYPIDPHQALHQIDRGVVAEKERVVGLLGRQEAHHHQHVDGLLAHRDALAHHLLRQLRRGQGHPVLHVNRRNIRVGPHGEGDGQAVGAVAGTGGGHVDHVVDAVHLGLDGGSHGGLHHLGAGTGIGGGDLDLGRRDVRELGHRDGGDGDQPRQGDDDGDDEGEFGPVDEKGGEHGSAPVLSPRRLLALGFSTSTVMPGSDLLQALDDHAFPPLPGPAVTTQLIPTLARRW